MKSMFSNNMYGINEMYEKRLIDLWEVDGVYPYTITQQYKQVFTEEYRLKVESMTPREKRIMTMQMNTIYGITGGIRSMYYSTSMGVGVSNLCQEVIPNQMFKFEDRAECHQKQLLVAHFTHKIKKTSKKKKQEIENLEKIIAIHQEIVDKQMDEYPERFI